MYKTKIAIKNYLGQIHKIQIKLIEILKLCILEYRKYILSICCFLSTPLLSIFCLVTVSIIYFLI